MSDSTAVSGKLKDKVCIVGFADGHKLEAPYDSDDFEFWGINRLHTDPAVPSDRFHRWFNLHDLIKYHGEDKEHLEFLAGFSGEIVLREEDIDKVPFPAVPFPRQELVERYGRYFNNTISWLIAYALELGFSEIHLYGVDMAQDAVTNAEYSHQRPSCEYFLGIAEGRGVKVHLPPGSDLLKGAYLYGFEDGDAWTQKLTNRIQEVGKRKEQAKQELAQLDARRTQLVGAINQLDGAMQDIQYWLRTWSPNKE